MNNHAKEKDYTSLDIEVAEQLLVLVKKHIYRISYKELSDKLESKPDPHFGLSTPLYNIGNLCFDLGLPFITFLVVAASSELPGEGFRALYEAHGIDVSNKTTKELYEIEMEKIKTCTKWKILADYFNLDIDVSAGGEVVFPDDIVDAKKYVEGTTKRICVNSFERDRYARSKCIDHYYNRDGKVICQICGFDFGKFYGEQYENMIHIHHIKELSKIRKEYQVDPIKDLLPVCPNCHMVLHSKVGESVEELKIRLNKD